MTDSEPRRVRRFTRRAVRTSRDAESEPVAEPSAIAASPPVVSPVERLLDESMLFDHDWYARQTRALPDRISCVRDYLARGQENRAHPHRLFDPAYFAGQLDDEQRSAMADADPLVFYVSEQLYGEPTHPLFDTVGYLERHPAARRFPGGPIAHYDQVGAEAGLPDLRDWISDRRTEWESAQARGGRMLRRKYRAKAGSSYRQEAASRVELLEAGASARSAHPVISVIVDAGRSREDVHQSLASLAEQRYRGFEVLVVRSNAGDDPGYAEIADAAVRVIDGDPLAQPMALNRALESAEGEFVCFLDAPDTWAPDRLGLLVDAIGRTESPFVADVMRMTLHDGRVTYATGGHPDGGVTTRSAVDLGRVLARTEALQELGGFDPSIRGSWAFDLMVRISQRFDITLLPTLGVHRDLPRRRAAQRGEERSRPPLDDVAIGSWADVSLNRNLIDWAELERRDPDPATISVIIPTYDDWEMTEAAVESVMASELTEGHTLECIVWDNGSSADVYAVLSSLAERYPTLRVVHSPVNYGFALGNNLALPHSHGATIVFLNNDVEVPPDWLRPLIDALADPEVLGAQSLLIYPSGAVQSAGVAFPSTGGLPHPLLQGFPLEDAASVGGLRFAALTGAALALRFTDVVALRGFDPIFTNGLEDVDLCQRLSAIRPGYFRVLPDAPVRHYESRTPGRYDKHLVNRAVYLDRWRGTAEPRDDAALWAGCGYRVVDHELVGHQDGRRWLGLPLPVLVREDRLRIEESPGRLRWAIKNPAPYGVESEQRSDTQLARGLAGALRDLGQEVVIDHQAEFQRATSRHDDVALVLRGGATFWPTPEQVSIAWVVSHPETFGRAEAAAYDRVMAASTAWSEAIGASWGLPVEPLLPATDPTRFDPDQAIPGTGHPVLFLGDSGGVYRAVVKDAIEAGLPLAVYGDGWDGLIKSRYRKGTQLTAAEAGAAYRSAGVVLIDQWDDLRANGFISHRLFDAVAAGARVVSADVEGLRQVFGDSVQTYRTPDDLVRLTTTADPDQVFGDDHARRAVAAQVARDHSFQVRAERLVKIAMEARGRRGFSA